MTIAEPEIQIPSDAPAEAGPLPRRVIETFTSPGELFARFGSAPPWVGVVAITAIVTAAMFALMPMEALVEMARSAAPPGQAGPDPETAATIMRITSIIGGLVMPFIATVFMAGLLKLIFGAMMGGEATYQQYLGVYGHAMLIVALGAIVTFPIILMSGDMTRQLTPALLLGDADPAAALPKILMQFGIFNLWQYAVIGVGVVRVNRGRISMGATYAALAAFYVLTALLAAIPALIQRG
jgi:hypothetical protein